MWYLDSKLSSLQELHYLSKRAFFTPSIEFLSKNIYLFFPPNFGNSKCIQLLTFENMNPPASMSVIVFFPLCHCLFPYKGGISPFSVSFFMLLNIIVPSKPVFKACKYKRVHLMFAQVKQIKDEISCLLRKILTLLRYYMYLISYSSLE